MSLLLKILNRAQIYDCEIGVVKCFDVYLSSPQSSPKEREKKSIFLTNELRGLLRNFKS